ncbi:MAG: hypothetical protein EZS28_027034, partial [Streblomastix strix]
MSLFQSDPISSLSLAQSYSHLDTGNQSLHKKLHNYDDLNLLPLQNTTSASLGLAFAALLQTRFALREGNIPDAHDWVQSALLASQRLTLPFIEALAHAWQASLSVNSDDQNIQSSQRLEDAARHAAISNMPNLAAVCTDSLALNILLSPNILKSTKQEAESVHKSSWEWINIGKTSQQLNNQSIDKDTFTPSIPIPPQITNIQQLILPQSTSISALAFHSIRLAQFLQYISQHSASLQWIRFARLICVKSKLDSLAALASLAASEIFH